MATQSLEFGYTTGQTLTAKLFAIGSDTVVATAGSVTEATEREGRYVAAFTDVPAGNYLLVYYLGGSGAGSEKYVLTLTTATFQPVSESLPAEIASIARQEMDANSTKLASISVDTDRIPASPATETTAAAAQTAAESALSRLGSWAATGRNTILGAFQALFRKDADATVPSDVNADLGGGAGTATNTKHSTQAIGAKTGLLGTGEVTVGAPVADNGSIPIIYQGDDYAAGRALTFTFTSSGFNVTNATSRFEAEPTQGSSFEATGTMTDNGDGTATASIPITSAQSELLETGPVAWSALNITQAGLRETVKKGSSPLERRKHG